MGLLKSAIGGAMVGFGKGLAEEGKDIRARKRAAMVQQFALDRDAANNDARAREGQLQRDQQQGQFDATMTRLTQTDADTAAFREQQLTGQQAAAESTAEFRTKQLELEGRKYRSQVKHQDALLTAQKEENEAKRSHDIEMANAAAERNKTARAEARRHDIAMRNKDQDYKTHNLGLVQDHEKGLLQEKMAQTLKIAQEMELGRNTRSNNQLASALKLKDKDIAAAKDRQSVLIDSNLQIQAMQELAAYERANLKIRDKNTQLSRKDAGDLAAKMAIVVDIDGNKSYDDNEFRRQYSALIKTGEFAGPIEMMRPDVKAMPSQAQEAIAAVQASGLDVADKNARIQGIIQTWEATRDSADAEASQAPTSLVGQPEGPMAGAGMDIPTARPRVAGPDIETTPVRPHGRTYTPEPRRYQQR